MNNNLDLSETAKDWQKFKNGKSKLRTWIINPELNKRELKYKDIYEMRKEKIDKLKKIRKEELGLSQSQMAKILHVNIRTLQGWEIGKSSPPEPVFILMQLYKDMPEVRKRLKAA